MRKYTLLSILIFLGTSSYAQTKWTLRQCIDYAVENNIEVKQQELEVKGTEIDLSTSKNSRLPNLNASADQSFDFGRAISMGSNTTITESATMGTTSFGVSSNMPLFTGFKISNQIKRDELNLKASVENLNKAKDDLSLSVTSLYLEALFKKEILKVYIEQVELSKLQVERTQMLVESGKVAASQLYDIKAQLSKDELNETVARNELDLALLSLVQSLNIVNNTEFDIEEPVINDVVDNNLLSILPPDQVYQLALTGKAVVKAADYSLESSKKGLKVAQSDYWPNLDLNLRYGTGLNHIYQKDYSNAGISDQLSRNQSKTIGFTLAIPIFNRFQVRNQVRKARLDIEYKELALENIKLALFKEIQQAYQSATAAQAKYMSTKKALEAAAESFKYAEERYAVGKASVFEFNEAKTKLQSSQSEQVQAKYDFLFRAKILDFYSGKELDLN